MEESCISAIEIKLFLHITFMICHWLIKNWSESIEKVEFMLLYDTINTCEQLNFMTHNSQ